MVKTMLELAKKMPRSVGFILLTALCLIRFGFSFLPLGKLPTEDIQQAIHALGGIPPEQRNSTWILVWPPHYSHLAEQLPKDLMASDALPQEQSQARRYSHITMLAPRNTPTPVELRETTEVALQEVGELSIRSFVFPESKRLLFDLRSEISKTQIQMETPEQKLLCITPRPDGGFMCPGRPEWNYLGPTQLMVNGQPWPCVWAHPISGEQLTINLGAQRLGDTIEIESALSDDAVNTPQGAAVDVRIEIDGQPAGNLTHANQTGVRVLKISTTANKLSTVKLYVTTNNDARRHFGLNLRLTTGITR